MNHGRIGKRTSPLTSQLPDLLERILRELSMTPTLAVIPGFSS